MNGKMLAIGVITLILSLSMPFVYATEPNEPHNANAMWIEPSTVSDTVSVGYRFNVTVWINLTSNPTGACGGWQFKLLYNKEYLNFTKAGLTAGSTSEFFEGISAVPLGPTSGSYNSTHNYVQIGESWMGIGDMRSVPGYGSLAWVEFEVIAVPNQGGTLLDIASGYHPPTSDTFAIDGENNEILLNVNNAIVVPEFSMMSATILMLIVTTVFVIMVKTRKRKI